MVIWGMLFCTHYLLFLFGLYLGQKRSGNGGD